MNDDKEYGSIELGLGTTRQLIGQLRYLEGKVDGIRSGISEGGGARASLMAGLAQVEAGLGIVRQRIDDAFTFAVGLPRDGDWDGDE